jgi:antitoxin PrlF
MKYWNFQKIQNIQIILAPIYLYMGVTGETDPFCSIPACRCSVEAILSIDERGQMVLPKDLRMRAGIGPGDKLAAVGLEREGRICCIVLIPAEQLAGPIRDVVGPLVKEVL